MRLDVADLLLAAASGEIATLAGLAALASGATRSVRRRRVAAACVAAALAAPVLSLAGWGWNVEVGTRAQADVAVADGRASATALGGDATTVVVALWVAGAAIVLARHAAGVVSLRRRAARASPVVDARTLGLAKACARDLGLRVFPPIRLDPTAPAPFVSGLRRPCLTLPTEALRWPDGRLRAVLWHELEHVRRGDLREAALGVLLCATRWFDPAAWRLARRLRDAREIDCDAAVVAAGERPSIYAAMLLHAVSRGAAPRAALGVGGGEPVRLERRIRALLAPEAPPSPAAAARTSAFATAAAIAALCLRPTLGASSTAAVVSCDDVPALASTAAAKGTFEVGRVDAAPKCAEAPALETLAATAAPPVGTPTAPEAAAPPAPALLPAEAPLAASNAPTRTPRRPTGPPAATGPRAAGFVLALRLGPFPGPPPRLR
ncbi:MAG TPA: M56 family metallopeptidase [Planctomycetota bacterium]|nr:M56 family metallopeptidase [Planctomycetota bacterium]